MLHKLGMLLLALRININKLECKLKSILVSQNFVDVLI